MDKAKTIVGWFIVIVLAVHYLPVIFRQGIPAIAEQAQALTTNVTSFFQF